MRWRRGLEKFKGKFPKLDLCFPFITFRSIWMYQRTKPLSDTIICISHILPFTPPRPTAAASISDPILSYCRAHNSPQTFPIKFPFCSSLSSPFHIPWPLNLFLDDDEVEEKFWMRVVRQNWYKLVAPHSLCTGDTPRSLNSSPTSFIRALLRTWRLKVPSSESLFVFSLLRNFGESLDSIPLPHIHLYDSNPAPSHSNGCCQGRGSSVYLFSGCLCAHRGGGGRRRRRLIKSPKSWTSFSRSSCSSVHLI